MFYKYIKFKNWTFWNQTFWNLTFCKPDVLKPDVLKPDVLKPDVLKPDVLKPDVLWVYLFNTRFSSYKFTLFQIKIRRTWAVSFWASWIQILPSSSKNSEKNLYFYCTVLWLHYDFLSLKSDVNKPSKCRKQKILGNLFFVGVLKVTDEKSRIVIRIY